MVSVNFRDGIEDEWFIVLLMCQLTRHFTDLVVRSVDNIGGTVRVMYVSL